MTSFDAIGLWETEDGYIRHELLTGRRYVEARGTREAAYRGRYRVTGNHIDYMDDTGFTVRRLPRRRTLPRRHDA